MNNNNRTMTTLDLRTSGKQSSICPKININIRSLKPELAEVNRLMSDNEIDILAFSETWLDEHHHIRLPHGRQIIRQDLTNHSSGIAIILRSHYQTCVVQELPRQPRQTIKICFMKKMSLEDFIIDRSIQDGSGVHWRCLGCRWKIQSYHAKDD